MTTRRVKVSVDEWWPWYDFSHTEGPYKEVSADADLVKRYEAARKRFVNIHKKMHEYLKGML